MTFPQRDSSHSFASGPEVEFCLELGRSLQAYGTPAHRFEDLLNRVASSLGMEGHFFSLPTGFFAWLQASGGEQHSFFLRSDAGAANLDKLATLQEITDAVVAGKLPLREASQRLRDALAAPPLYGAMALVVSSGLTSGAFSVFFKAGWRELVGSLICGTLVGLAAALSLERAKLRRLLPAIGAVAVSGLAAGLARLLPGTSIAVISLCGIIGLLPGLSLITSLNELATGNLMSGTSRLAGTMMVFLQLAFGIGLGSRLVGIALPPLAPVASLAPLPTWALLVSLAVIPICSLILFHARPRELPYVALSCWVAYAGARAGTALLGPEFGAGIGAYLLGVGANLYARYLNRPAIVTLLPSLLMIVPGAVAFQSMERLAAHETMASLEAAIQMVFIAVSLLVGLLLSRLTVEPRRPL